MSSSVKFYQKNGFLYNIPQDAECLDSSLSEELYS